MVITACHSSLELCRKQTIGAASSTPQFVWGSNACDLQVLMPLFSMPLQVNYCESISKKSDVRYIHKKQSGGSGQFADISLRFEPAEPGSGFEFVSEIKGGAVPKEYIPGVVKGLEECMDSGVLAGFPVVDMKATLYDGAFHEVDSSVMAFQIAGRGAFRDGVSKAMPRLLEPVMKVCEHALK